MILRKILIVDDSEINRLMLRNALSSDYEILEAENGADALELLKRKYRMISAVLLDIVMPVMDGYSLLARMRENPLLALIPVLVTSAMANEEAEAKALSLGANDFIAKPFNPSLVKQRLKNTIRLRETASTINALQRDELTGLYNRRAFFDRAKTMIAAREPGYYVLACFDVNSFKVINDQYGTQKGDEVLKFLAAIFRAGFVSLGGICCRIMDDNFAMLYPRSAMDSEELETIRLKASVLDGSMQPITFSIGRYIVEDRTLAVSAMYDRAMLALHSVRERYDLNIGLYEETMREHLLKEQQIVTEMRLALDQGQFEVWFQPQYNHLSGALIGAEALVRWRHPQNGLLVPPGNFIPVFERNGFIYEMDKYVWQQTCMLLRKWIDEGLAPLPVSMNVSRADVFHSDFFDVITGYVQHYRIPIDLVRLEITETAFANATKQILAMVKRLIAFGFTVEIDDFGSGYSSLNTLKDVPATILKLDMKFLENDEDSARGGNILESIVRMAKWLGMAVIAEGVETIEQAEFLKSIGCYYVQGYLYARPMPAASYEALLTSSGREEKMIRTETVEHLDNNAFWDPKSMDTLIFNSYIGGACIFEYKEGKLELLRANDQYARMLLGFGASVNDVLTMDVGQYMSDADREKMHDNILSAIDSGAETTCETTLWNLPGHSKPVCLRTTVRVIAKAGERMLLYGSLIDVTAQRESEQKEREVADQLHAIMESINGGVSAIAVGSGGARPVFANSQYYAMLGYTKEQYGDEVESAFSLLHPDDAESVRQTIDQIQITGEGASMEFRCRKRDGSFLPVRCNSSITGISGIEERVLLSVITDLSKKESQELSIRDMLPVALAAMMESSSDLAFIKDRDLRYISCSRAFLNEYGFADESSIIGKTDYDFAEPEMAAIYAVSDREILESGLPKLNYTELMPREDERTRYVSTSKYPLLDSAGNVIGIYGVCREITEAREAYSQLKLLTDNIPGGIARYELSEKSVRILYSNEGFCTQTGYTQEEYRALAGSDPFCLVFSEDMPALRAQIQAVLQGADALDCMYRVHGKSDGVRWINLRGSVSERRNGIVTINVVKLDITAMKQLSEDETEAVRKSDQVLQTVASHSNRLIYRYDVVMRTAYGEASVFSQHGMPPVDRNMPESVIEDGTILPESVEEFRAVFHDLHAGIREGGARIHMRDHGGKIRWSEMRYTIIDYAGSEPLTAVISYLDITDAHEKEMAYERYRQTVSDDEKKEGLVFFETDLTSDVVEKHGGNIPFIQFPKVGGTHMDAVQYGIDHMVPQGERERVRAFFSRERLLAAYSDGVRSQSEDLPVVLPDGEEFWFRAEIQMIQDPYSGHIRIYTILRDATNEILAEMDVRRQAEIDGMTGLYNKTVAESLIKQRMTRGEERPCALMIFDLDNLKSINDTLGHDQGDVAIRHIAETLRMQFRKTDIVGRIGGDEFIVFLDGGGNETRLRALLITFMRKLSALRIGEDRNIAVNGSIGVAIGTIGQDGYIDLFRKADRALYHVKRNGKNDFAFYTPDMDQTGYVFKGHETVALWQTDVFDKAELDYLLKAVSTLYPLVISANLTQNSYYMMQYDRYMTRSAVNSGIFDELITEGASTFHPDDRASFIEKFSRDKLLAAEKRGEKLVSHIGRQRGDDGVYRRIRTDAVFVHSKSSSDVLEISLARECAEDG